jgi:small nuclear ribonucleoprotein (snRNP)-like protein
MQTAFYNLRSYYAHFMKCILIIFFSFLAKTVDAQRDSLVLKNGDLIVGEIKSMDRGVVTIETAYSDKDFAIEWLGIKRIYSTSHFLVSLKDGRRINGSFRSVDTTSNRVLVETSTGEKVETTLEDMVFLKGIKSKFWSRINAYIDLGLSLTKANNLRQFSVRSGIAYTADKWSLKISYDGIRSSQDSIEDTKRTETGITFKYFLQNDWYLMTSANLLSNTEQALKLRATGKLGGGKYLTHTNKSYWGLGAGLSFNNESFTNGTEKRNSLEAYFGSELNLFDIGDLSLLSNIFVYPSITESGRWRTDFTFDSKYEFPLDLYLKLGFTLNYDNRPAIPGNKTDYVLAFSVGWEFD